MAKLTPFKTWSKRHATEVWPQVAVVVAVTWDDATYSEDLGNSGLARAVTVGFVQEVAPEYIKIAAEVFVDKSVRDVSTIPAGMIVGVQTLTRAVPVQETPGPLPKQRRV